MPGQSSTAEARKRRQRQSAAKRGAASQPRQRRVVRAEVVKPAGVARRSRRLPARTGGLVQRIAVLAGVAGLVAVLAWLFVDETFYVVKADVDGLHYSSPAEVYQRAGIDGYSIFWVDSRATARRLETLPYVKEAAVHASLPNRVRIEIEERSPVAVWKVGGRDYWVDVEGITMPVASQVDTLPILWDLDGSTVAFDGTVDRELIAAVQSLKQQQPEVFEFGYSRVDGLQFRMPTGTIVTLGQPDGLARRVRQLAVLQQSLASEGRTPAEINWRVEDGFYFR